MTSGTIFDDHALAWKTFALHWEGNDGTFESPASVELPLKTPVAVPVKILAKGELGKALTVHAHAFSAGARARIEAAGGSCELIEE